MKLLPFKLRDLVNQVSAKLVQSASITTKAFLALKMLCEKSSCIILSLAKPLFPLATLVFLLTPAIITIWYVFWGFGTIKHLAFWGNRAFISSDIDMDGKKESVRIDGFVYSGGNGGHLMLSLVDDDGQLLSCYDIGEKRSSITLLEAEKNHIKVKLLTHDKEVSHGLANPQLKAVLFFRYDYYLKYLFLNTERSTKLDKFYTAPRPCDLESSLLLQTKEFDWLNLNSYKHVWWILLQPLILNDIMSHRYTDSSYYNLEKKYIEDQWWR
jgi:hypothetical protein